MDGGHGFVPDVFSGGSGGGGVGGGRTGMSEGSGISEETSSMPGVQNLWNTSAESNNDPTTFRESNIRSKGLKVVELPTRYGISRRKTQKE